MLVEADTTSLLAEDREDRDANAEIKSFKFI